MKLQHLRKEPWPAPTGGLWYVRFRRTADGYGKPVERQGSVDPMVVQEDTVVPGTIWRPGTLAILRPALIAGAAVFGLGLVGLLYGLS